MKKILFISHDATQTGAPFILLYFIEWLSKNKSNLHIDILFLRNGALLPKFKELANEVYTTKTGNTNSFLKKVTKKVRPYFGINEIEASSKLALNLSKKGYNIIYANTVVSIPFAKQVKQNSLSTKLVAHIHELNGVIRTELPNLDTFINDIDEVIAPSHLVKNNLIKNWSFKSEEIIVVNEFSKLNANAISKTNLTNNFIVGASGGINWRKGYDIFIQVAIQVKQQQPDAAIKFLWVGGGSNSERDIIIEEDLRKSGLESIIDFVGSKDYPESYYTNFDVFIMTSREDPFPLVCIEVAMLSKPIICFQNATGTAEVLINGGGEIVPYLDTLAMANEIVLYYKDKEKRITDGNRAKTLFSQFTPEQMCPKIYEILKKYL